MSNLVKNVSVGLVYEICANCGEEVYVKNQREFQPCPACNAQIKACDAQRHHKDPEKRCSLEECADCND